MGLHFVLFRICGGTFVLNTVYDFRFYLLLFVLAVTNSWNWSFISTYLALMLDCVLNLYSLMVRTWSVGVSKGIRQFVKFIYIIHYYVIFQLRQTHSLVSSLLIRLTAKIRNELLFTNKREIKRFNLYIRKINEIETRRKKIVKKENEVISIQRRIHILNKRQKKREW